MDLAEADKEVGKIRSAILDGKFHRNNVFNMHGRDGAIFYITIHNRTYLVCSDVGKR